MGLRPVEAVEVLLENELPVAGDQESVDVEVREEVVRPKDLFLICSDGLSGLVEDEEMRDIFLQSPEDLKMVAVRLVDMANERGGIDNISVAIVDAHDS